MYEDEYFMCMVILTPDVTTSRKQQDDLWKEKLQVIEAEVTIQEYKKKRNIGSNIA
jgi:hypothetical protein